MTLYDRSEGEEITSRCLVRSAPLKGPANLPALLPGFVDNQLAARTPRGVSPKRARPAPLVVIERHPARIFEPATGIDDQIAGILD
jgi:hypothetical protein